jgi:uncharacterized protein
LEDYMPGRDKTRSPLARTLRLALTGAALALAAAPALAQGQDPGPTASPPGTIRVVGEATVTARPDQAELDLGVVSDAPTAEAAAADNNKKMERILAALKKDLGANSDVKTVGYMVTQRLADPKPNQRHQAVIGYTVTNVVRAKIPDVKAAGRIVDLGLKNGANEVQRLIFTLKNPDPVQAEALKAAAGKARTRATALAGALGLRLGNVVSVSDGDFQQRPMYAESANMRFKSADMANTPIEAGNLEVSATVTVFFATSR